MRAIIAVENINERIHNCCILEEAGNNEIFWAKAETDLLLELKNHPDILVIEAFFLKSDLLETLEIIRQKYARLNVIVLLPAAAESLREMLYKSGANYIMEIPIKGKKLLKRMKALCDAEKTDEYSKKLAFASQILLKLCILPKVTGYKYIIYSMEIAFKNRDILSSLTKCLYPEISKKFNSTPQNVERAIRNAINISYQKYKGDEIYSLLGYDVGTLGKPGNGLFLKLLYNCIEVNS